MKLPQDVKEQPQNAGDESKFDPKTKFAKRLQAELPQDGAQSEGATYCVFCTVYDGSNLSDLPGPIAIEGVRMPDLPHYLRALAPSKKHPLELDWLALVARSNPELDLAGVLRRAGEVCPENLSGHYKALQSGKLTEDQARANVRWIGGSEPRLALNQSEHCAEFGLFDGFNWNVWLLFDDLWASAHPVLARALLRFGQPIDKALTKTSLKDR